MKRIIYIISLLIIVSPCFAGGVGYINYEKVASSYNFARNSMIEIQTKASEIACLLI